MIIDKSRYMTKREVEIVIGMKGALEFFKIAHKNGYGVNNEYPMSYVMQYMGEGAEGGTKVKFEHSRNTGKINTREWNSTRKGEEFNENQHTKEKNPAYREGLKRTKMRWNKKKGVREKSKKGSRDRIYWND